MTSSVEIHVQKEVVAVRMDGVLTLTNAQKVIIIATASKKFASTHEGEIDITETENGKNFKPKIH